MKKYVLIVDDKTNKRRLNLIYAKSTSYHFYHFKIIDVFS